MSTPYSSQPEESPKVPQLSEAYRNAKKHYVFASVVLASWEPLGITLIAKELLGIEAKNPRAIPLILFAVVVFCGFEMVIEWLQCGPERNTLAKIDYWITHLIAIGAIVISMVQYSANIHPQ